ncbi:UvrD-helicase domain-containing protein [Endozoicomonas acroporae]|uniref:UvrD-helicase domain-containing protein n=1 Tax=Endozoicomonas acroporae TaxID=1701104 RepID=UPI003D7AFDC0
MSVEAVLRAELGAVIAPAGCGKTHLITEALSLGNNKPTLVLTHTTAGVTALRKRLARLSIPSRNAQITTIDGWALRIANAFSISCVMTTNPDNPREFYPQLRSTVHRFVASGALHDALKASYSRVFVDEYQDCDEAQHSLIVAISAALPTVVFGDPMQCIFDFAGRMPLWDREVLTHFPVLITLNTPWRWNNAQAPVLGQWILSTREALSRGEVINFHSCPNHVNYYLLSGNPTEDLRNQQQVQNAILRAHPEDTLLIIGDSINAQSRHTYARGSYGTGVVEPVQLSDVVRTANIFDRVSGLELVDAVLDFAGTVMTNVESAQTRRRVESILNGRNRTVATVLEQALCVLANDSSKSNLLHAVQMVESKQGVRVYRRAAYNALKDSISLTLAAPGRSVAETASVIREQIRQQGDKRIPRRAIGSTLLLKGLEADHVLILNAAGMNPRHLYVALSRGAKTVSVFSRSPYACCASS